MILPNDYIFGFLCGVASTLGITFVVAWSYSRITGMASPTGVTYQSPSLPFVLKDDHAEARIEKEYYDAIPGLGK